MPNYTEGVRMASLRILNWVMESMVRRLNPLPPSINLSMARLFCHPKVIIAPTIQQGITRGVDALRFGLFELDFVFFAN
jgi:hypothetical protein